MLNLRKKYHFKFKRKRSLKRHILKSSLIGFKLKNTSCIQENQQNFIKLLVLKQFRKNFVKKSKIFFYFNCNYNKTKLPLESRMGKGKGEISTQFGYYKSGFVLFELKNFSLNNAINLKNYLNKKNVVKFKLIF